MLWTSYSRWLRLLLQSTIKGYSVRLFFFQIEWKNKHERFCSRFAADALRHAGHWKSIVERFTLFFYIVFAQWRTDQDNSNQAKYIIYFLLWNMGDWKNAWIEKNIALLNCLLTHIVRTHTYAHTYTYTCNIIITVVSCYIICIFYNKYMYSALIIVQVLSHIINRVINQK